MLISVVEECPWQDSTCLHAKKKVLDSRTEWNTSQHDKGYIQKTHSQLLLNGETLEKNLIEIRSETGYPLCPFLFNIVLQALG